MKVAIFISLFLFMPLFVLGQTCSRELKICKQYLNIPIDMAEPRQQVIFACGTDTLKAVIRIADKKTDYWVFKDVSAYRGKTLTLVFSKNVSGVEQIFEADTFVGQENLYHELLRPQFHFSSRRGWNNDPNGLVYFDGEYHLFYQHNPFEIEWENMHWGHAVSRDLIHWQELDDVLYPDQLGAMFSGSSVIDVNNTAGWGKNALVAIYTAAGAEQVQCVAYSHDRGRSFTKYVGNPVFGPTRDPKVIWNKAKQEWAMALFDDAGIRFQTSKNLKEWTSHCYINGFWECPEFFELPVDGDPDRKMWVLYGGSGTYMLGDFDGRIFMPKYGKYRTCYGALYAAQTYNDCPDGKRIQIGWGRIESKGMPFNQLMCFPTELTLRTTNEGIRLFSEPIAAIENLHRTEYVLSGLDVVAANGKLAGIKHDLLHVKARLESLNGGRILLHFRGNRVGQMDGDEINGIQTPFDEPGKLIFDMELLIDRTCIESFYQRGQIVFVDALQEASKEIGLQISGDEKNIKIHRLEVYELDSIW